jgi:mono/diheme cytochrome c family protein
MRKDWISYVFLLMSLTFPSCSKDSRHEAGHSAVAEHTPANWKFTLPPGDSVEGKKLFLELECYKCHQIKGESLPTVDGADAAAGPELSQMAGMHPLEFFAESVVNPNAVIDAEDQKRGYLGSDGKSKMPDYSDLLTVKQLADLATYLSAVKGAQKHSAH